MYCPNCGKQISDSAKFCPKCGAKTGVETKEPVMSKSIPSGQNRPQPPSAGQNKPPQPPSAGQNKPPQPPSASQNKPPQPPSAGQNKPPQPSSAGQNKPPQQPSASQNKPPQAPSAGQNKPPQAPSAGQNKPPQAPSANQNKPPQPQPASPNKPSPAPAPVQNGRPEPPQKKGKAVPILIALLVIVLAAAAGLVYYTGQKKSESKQEEMRDKEENKDREENKDKEENDGEDENAGGSQPTETTEAVTEDALEAPTQPVGMAETVAATISGQPPVRCSLLYTSQADFSGLSKIVIQKEDVTQSSFVVQDNTTIDNSGWSAFDGRAETSWQEGLEDDGIGESVTAQFDRERQIKTLTFLLGNHRSEAWYVKNNRPKTLTVILGSQSFQVEFPDEMSEYAVVFSEPVSASDLKVVIDDVYRGTEYRDTVVSEIGVYGN